MKQLVCLMLVLCLAVSCFGFSVLAQDEEAYVVVMLNDEEVVSDAEPFITNDRTMVGLRGIFEQMGAEVIWNGEENSVVIAHKELGREVKLVLGETAVSVKTTVDGKEDTKELTLDVAPVLKGERTYVPLRFVAETFDCVVDYYVSEQQNTDVVIIYTSDFEFKNLVTLFEETYQVTPIEDEAIPKVENVTYYELGDELLIPMGKDHLITYRKAVLNFFGVYTYDDVTGYFGDGSWVNNSYQITKYNETIKLSIVSDPRLSDSNEEAYLTVTDNKLAVVGSPVVKVEYSDGKSVETDEKSDETSDEKTDETTDETTAEESEAITE